MIPLRRLLLLAAAMLGLWATAAQAQDCSAPVAVCGEDGAGRLALVAAGRPATVLIDAAADPAVGHAARAFAADLGRVGGTAGQVVQDPAAAQGPVVLIGQLGRSALIEDLRSRGLIDPADLAGQWEAY
ncbi:MAG TPA: hypothetical protein VI168_05615, partial [Croceibacterium sp.]